MKKIDELINRITMYRLVLWSLRILFAVSWILSILGILPYGPFRPLISASILLAATFGFNYLFAKIYKVTVNNESSNITALILYFIFQPPKDINSGIFLSLAAVIAIASKYVITHNERHIFNPAAFGAVVIGLAGLMQSRWWIGSREMFVFALLVGIIIVRKIHRFPLVLSFIISAGLASLLRSDLDTVSALKNLILSFPILFLATVMLTEPVTTPPRKNQQIIYGLIVGLLFSSRLHAGSNYMTPELALVFGNLFVYAIAPRSRQPLKLKSIDEIGSTIYEYTFEPVRPLNYSAGQYLEITLPLDKSDSRGNRRSFTVASSPTEKEVKFAIKQVEPLSAFKSKFSKLEEGQIVSANNLAGDFVLPDGKKTKLVFIAGGIGVTPFRSMLKYLTDNRQNRNISLFYCISDSKQIVYKDVLNDAKAIGLKVVYVLSSSKDSEIPKSWTGELGFLNKQMLAKHVLDYRDRTYYISGPDAMVKANKKMLTDAGIKTRRIKTDYFAGY